MQAKDKATNKAKAQNRGDDSESISVKQPAGKYETGCYQAETEGVPTTAINTSSNVTTPNGVRASLTSIM